jgi:DNA-binding FrmR family transcriptional regulator
MKKFRESEIEEALGAEHVNRLNRLAGQISGIARMIDEGRSAQDILTQFKAVRSALNAAESLVVELALRDGVERAMQSSDRLEMARRLEDLFRLRTSESARL